MENYFISILVFLIIEIPVFTLFPAKNSKKKCCSREVLHAVYRFLHEIKRSGRLNNLSVSGKYLKDYV